MCYITSQKVNAKKLIEVYQKPFEQENELREYFKANGFAHPKLAIVTSEEIKLMQWGLMPNWSNKTLKDMMIQAKKTLNARDNTIFELPSFRGSIRKMRCIVPVTGFYEPHTHNGVKYPFYITAKNGELLNLAGIFAYWKEPISGDWIGSFSIITTGSNRIIGKIHNEQDRMPVVINDRIVPTWLDNDLPDDGIKALMQPCVDEELIAYSVSRDLYSPKVDTNNPKILERVEYPELAYDEELYHGFNLAS